MNLLFYVILGDFNAHSPTWWTDDKTSNEAAHSLMNFLQFISLYNRTHTFNQTSQFSWFHCVIQFYCLSHDITKILPLKFQNKSNKLWQYPNNSQENIRKSCTCSTVVSCACSTVLFSNILALYFCYGCYIIPQKNKFRSYYIWFIQQHFQINPGITIILMPPPKNVGFLNVIIIKMSL